MPALPATTLTGLESARRDIVGAWGRRGFLAAVALVLVAALFGCLGVHAGTATASEDGWTLELTYPAIARAGLDIPLTARVTHRGGFGKEITLALTGDYLDIYETQGFNPDPSSGTRDGDTLYLTFDAPTSGDTFMVRYDAYVQPAAQRGKAGTLSIVSDGHRLATVDFDTRLLP